MCNAVDGNSGVFGPSDVARLRKHESLHTPGTKVVAVENTHNRGGGTVWPFAQLQSLSAYCRSESIALYMDGARLWNAHVASGISLASYAAQVDLLGVCFSKGMGCPVGAALVGKKSAMAKALRLRKRYGGGMRQSGMLAAAASYALDHHVARLADDHANARYMAERLAHLSGLVCNKVESNMVVLDLLPFGKNEDDLLAAWEAQGLLVGCIGQHRIRLVTHLDVARDDCDRAAKIIAASF